MMLWEGGVIGAIDAIVATVIALALSFVIQLFVRYYVSLRIGESYTGNVFEFSLLDVALIFALAIIVCVIASILPALRASRLDPIEAMRK
jgi:ABC-type lipoprotein release transport system permease subunit